MTEPRNMDEPVTRRELHEALEIWGGNILGKLTVRIDQLMDHVATEIPRQIRASEERLRDYMRALVEPHDGVPERVTKLEEDLPPRVERLEARVFAPKRGSTSRGSGSRGRTRSRRR